MSLCYGRVLATRNPMIRSPKIGGVPLARGRAKQPCRIKPGPAAIYTHAFPGAIWARVAHAVLFAGFCPNGCVRPPESSFYQAQLEAGCRSSPPPGFPLRFAPQPVCTIPSAGPRPAVQPSRPQPSLAERCLVSRTNRFDLRKSFYAKELRLSGPARLLRKVVTLIQASLGR